MRGVIGRSTVTSAPPAGELRRPVVFLSRESGPRCGAASKAWYQVIPPVDPDAPLVAGWGTLTGEQSYLRSVMWASREDIRGSENVADGMESGAHTSQWRLPWVAGVTPDMRLRDVGDPLKPVDYAITTALNIEGRDALLVLLTIRLRDSVEVAA